MKCYIYKIINIVTNEKYVGQTTNFSRRIDDHFQKLRANKHPNPKLQNAWNKYGEASFIVTKTKYDCSKEELDKKEIDAIAFENSFANGYNLTAGGTGGDTRSKLKFDDYCEIYFGNKRYDGMTNRAAIVYHCDSSTISAIKREKAYDAFRQKALSLDEEEQKRYLQSFEEKTQVLSKPPTPKKANLTTEEVIAFLSVISTYARGAEAAFLREAGLSKGLGHHITKGSYPEARNLFAAMTDEEISQIGQEYFTKHNLQQNCTQRIKRNTSVKRPAWCCAP